MGLPARRETSQGAKGTALGRERHPSEPHQPRLACVHAQSVAAVRLAKERAVVIEWLLVEQQLGLVKVRGSTRAARDTSSRSSSGTCGGSSIGTRFPEGHHLSSAPD